jgi:hypothetical protein
MYFQLPTSPNTVKDYLAYDHVRWKDISFAYDLIDEEIVYTASVSLTDVPFIIDLLHFQDHLMTIDVLKERVFWLDPGATNILCISTKSGVAGIFASLFQTYCEFYTHLLISEQIFMIHAQEIPLSMAKFNVSYFCFIPVTWNTGYTFCCFPCIIKMADYDEENDRYVVIENLQYHDCIFHSHMAFVPVCIHGISSSAYINYEDFLSKNALVKGMLHPEIQFMELDLDMLTTLFQEGSRRKTIQLWRNLLADVPFAYGTFTDLPRISTIMPGYFEFDQDQKDVSLCAKHKLSIH